MNPVGQKIGYVRISSVDQNPDRQIKLLENYNVHKIYMDKCSGGSRTRPKLIKMLDYVREGDCIYVASLDRLGRRMSDINKIVDYLNDNNITIHFLKENFIIDGKEGSISRLMFNIFGAFAEFERSVIRERQQEGILLAKQRGVYKSKKKCLTPKKLTAMIERIDAGESVSAVCREFKVSRASFYKYKKEAQKSVTSNTN